LAGILIVDDFEPWLSFVKATLVSLPGSAPVTTAADGFDAIRKAGELMPDLILLDISLPGCNGIEAALEILKLAPEAQIIFFSLAHSADFVRAALDSGARGFLSKHDAGELLHAIQAVQSGEQYLSKSVRALPLHS
jgi:DNA-binding NarL/FixJ family response regulator